MRARVGSPWFVPKLETRTGSAMPVTLRAVGTQVLRGCVWFVASLLLRCRGRFSRLFRALPHEAGFFFHLRGLASYHSSSGFSEEEWLPLRGGLLW